MSEINLVTARKARLQKSIDAGDCAGRPCDRVAQREDLVPQSPLGQYHVYSSLQDWSNDSGGNMRKTPSRWCALLLFCTLSGCAASGDRVNDASSDSLRSIYVIRRGWHTGIAVAKSDWPNQRWALLGDFPDATYLEFGWGDERFYQAERETVWLALRAALWPSSSVVHVIGLRAPVPLDAHANEIVEVRVGVAGLDELADAIAQEFAGVHPVTTGVTLSSAPAPNQFYEARGRFFFPRMCNWWIASRLQEAGCPIMPWTVISASRVIREARACGANATPVR